MRQCALAIRWRRALLIWKSKARGSELIVINDGSTDSTGEVIRKVAAGAVVGSDSIARKFSESRERRGGQKRVVECYANRLRFFRRRSFDAD